MVEKLAEAVHELFCEALLAKGWKYGPVMREDLKEHNSLKPYAQLPENEKEQNRGNARDIQHKITRMAYTIIQMRGNLTPAQFSKDEVEKLAQEEHERWMKQKYVAGWKYAKKTIKSRKLHKDLVDWNQLPESGKEKDRALVRGIPKILAKAGYIMVKVGK